MFGTKKRAIGIGMMLVLTTFAYSAAHVMADDIYPVAEAGGPYVSSECTEITFDASGSYDPLGGTLEYRWNFMGDDWTDWSYFSVIQYAYLDDYTNSATLEVRARGLTASDTTSVTVSNAPPTITNIDLPPDPVNVGDDVLVTIHFFDGDPRQNSLDTYEATFFWGDGTSTVYSHGKAAFPDEDMTITGDHVYAAPGVYSGSISLLDDNGGETNVYFTITVVGSAITFTVDAGPDGTINEGSLFTSAGSFYCSVESDFTGSVNYGEGSGPQTLLLNPDHTFALSHEYIENGIYPLTVTITIDGSETVSDNAQVSVNNVAPTITSLSGPPTDPVLVGASISLTGVFTDPGTLDTHVALITWDDGTSTTVNLDVGVYQVSKSHSYASVGVYIITLTVTDDDGGSDTKSIDSYVVVYSPSGGFITGGGWLISPAGSYPADPTVTGRVNFGFVCKYKKGQTVPDGETEFQFQIADINFHSQFYEWLVITGAKGTYQGVGTINGQGHYGFKVIVIDGQQSGGGGVDKFRMKIWDKDHNDQIVYDTDYPAPDSQNPSVALSGGQITIHKV